MVLVEPEIPPNTGNVARTCAAAGLGLHLVRPLGFELDDRHLKRAGLDYWPLLAEFCVHEGWEQFEAAADGPLILATSRAARPHSGTLYPPGRLYLVFGRETAGLRPDILARYPDHVRIPMVPGARSLNLASAVAVVVYEVLRQRGYPGLL